MLQKPVRQPTKGNDAMVIPIGMRKAISPISRQPPCSFGEKTFGDNHLLNTLTRTLTRANSAANEETVGYYQQKCDK